MRELLFTGILITLAVCNLFGQEGISSHLGKVSYMNSRNVYVKFSSTEMIEAGDTLFVRLNNELRPVLVVENLSSISCVCTPIGDVKLSVGDEVLFPRKVLKPSVVESQPDSALEASEVRPPVIYTPEPDVSELPNKGESLRGRLQLSWYGNFYNEGLEDIHRMRYVYTMQARNIGGSRFSVETYLSFRHTFGEWDEVRADFNRAFKAYNLSVMYEPNATTSISLGRKINRGISNIGAIDGLQVEKTFSSFSVGAFAGFRPDPRNYSFNTDLLQFGAYGIHRARAGEGSMENTLAFVQQFSKSATDRRFAYIQHTNSIFKKVYVFTSFEFDLFKNVDDNPTSTFRLSTLYLSARYRASSKFSLFLSYDARNNLIYYETYKNSVDRLIEDETRQGLRLRLNFRPARRLTIGLSGGYRFQTDNTTTAQNVYGYISYSQIPWVKASVSANVTYLKTAYLSGRVYGVRLSRDIVKGKVFGDLQYRFVDYTYSFTESKLKQNIASVNLTWRVFDRTSLGIYYEGLFSERNDYNRTHVNLIYRF